MKISATATPRHEAGLCGPDASAQQFELGSLLQFFELKYAQTRYNNLHILKLLTFFEYAEKDPMPYIFIPIDWQQVKEFFVRQTSRLVQL